MGLAPTADRDPAGQAGQPTPEGLHRDGVDYVLVLLVRRVNIASGTTTVHDLSGGQLGSFTLTDPCDAALVDDARVMHGLHRSQTVRIRGIGLTIRLEASETIWTESSYKFTRLSARAMLAEAGLRLEAWHTDPESRFALTVAARRSRAATAPASRAA